MQLQPSILRYFVFVNLRLAAAHAAPKAAIERGGYEHVTGHATAPCFSLKRLLCYVSPTTGLEYDATASNGDGKKNNCTGVGGKQNGPAPCFIHAPHDVAHKLESDGGGEMLP